MSDYDLPLGSDQAYVVTKSVSCNKDNNNDNDDSSDNNKGHEDSRAPFNLFMGVMCHVLDVNYGSDENNHDRDYQPREQDNNHHNNHHRHRQHDREHHVHEESGNGKGRESSLRVSFDDEHVDVTQRPGDFKLGSELLVCVQSTLMKLEEVHDDRILASYASDVTSRLLSIYRKRHTYANKAGNATVDDIHFKGLSEDQLVGAEGSPTDVTMVSSVWAYGLLGLAVLPNDHHFGVASCVSDVICRDLVVYRHQEDDGGHRHNHANKAGNAMVDADRFKGLSEDQPVGADRSITYVTMVSYVWAYGHLGLAVLPDDHHFGVAGCVSDVTCRDLVVYRHHEDDGGHRHNHANKAGNAMVDADHFKDLSEDQPVGADGSPTDVTMVSYVWAYGLLGLAVLPNDHHFGFASCVSDVICRDLVVYRHHEDDGGHRHNHANTAGNAMVDADHFKDLSEDQPVGAEGSPTKVTMVSYVWSYGHLGLAVLPDDHHFRVASCVSDVTCRDLVVYRHHEDDGGHRHNHANKAGNAMVDANRFKVLSEDQPVGAEGSPTDVTMMSYVWAYGYPGLAVLPDDHHFRVAGCVSDVTCRDLVVYRNHEDDGGHRHNHANKAGNAMVDADHFKSLSEDQPVGADGSITYVTMVSYVWAYGHLGLAVLPDDHHFGVAGCVSDVTCRDLVVYRHHEDDGGHRHNHANKAGNAMVDADHFKDLSEDQPVGADGSPTDVTMVSYVWAYGLLGLAVLPNDHHFGFASCVSDVICRDLVVYRHHEDDGGHRHNHANTAGNAMVDADHFKDLSEDQPVGAEGSPTKVTMVSYVWSYGHLGLAVLPDDHHFRVASCVSDVTCRDLVVYRHHEDDGGHRHNHANKARNAMVDANRFKVLSEDQPVGAEGSPTDVTMMSYVWAYGYPGLAVLPDDHHFRVAGCVSDVTCRDLVVYRHHEDDGGHRHNHANKAGNAMVDANRFKVLSEDQPVGAEGSPTDVTMMSYVWAYGYPGLAVLPDDHHFRVAGCVSDVTCRDLVVYRHHEDDGGHRHNHANKAGNARVDADHLKGLSEDQPVGAEGSPTDVTMVSYVWAYGHLGLAVLSDDHHFGVAVCVSDVTCRDLVVYRHHEDDRGHRHNHVNKAGNAMVDADRFKSLSEDQPVGADGNTTDVTMVSYVWAYGQPGLAVLPDDHHFRVAGCVSDVTCRDLVVYRHHEDDGGHRHNHANKAGNAMVDADHLKGLSEVQPVGAEWNPTDVTMVSYVWAYGLLGLAVLPDDHHFGVAVCVSDVTCRDLVVYRHQEDDGGHRHNHANKAGNAMVDADRLKGSSEDQPVGADGSITYVTLMSYVWAYGYPGLAVLPDDHHFRVAVCVSDVTCRDLVVYRHHEDDGGHRHNHANKAGNAMVDADHFKGLSEDLPVGAEGSPTYVTMVSYVWAYGHPGLAVLPDDHHFVVAGCMSDVTCRDLVVYRHHEDDGAHRHNHANKAGNAMVDADRFKGLSEDHPVGADGSPTDVTMVSYVWAYGHPGLAVLPDDHHFVVAGCVSDVTCRDLVVNRHHEDDGGHRHNHANKAGNAMVDADRFKSLSGDQPVGADRNPTDVTMVSYVWAYGQPGLAVLPDDHYFGVAGCVSDVTCRDLVVYRHHEDDGGNRRSHSNKAGNAKVHGNRFKGLSEDQPVGAEGSPTDVTVVSYVRAYRDLDLCKVSEGNDDICFRGVDSEHDGLDAGDCSMHDSTRMSLYGACLYFWRVVYVVSVGLYWVFFL